MYRSIKTFAFSVFSFFFEEIAIFQKSESQNPSTHNPDSKEKYWHDIKVSVYSNNPGSRKIYP